MTVVSYLGVHARLAPCFVVVNGTVLFDEFMQSAFLAQPAVLGKVLLLLTYSYVIFVGLLVWNGRNLTKEKFVAEAAKTN